MTCWGATSCRATSTSCGPVVDHEPVRQDAADTARDRACRRRRAASDWNQPRYWSVPSRYMSAGQVSSGRSASTASWLEPESNHTSRMSRSRSKLVPLAARARQAGRDEVLSRAARTRRRRCRCSNTRAACSTISGVRIGFAAGRAGERGNRHAPRALPRNAPVRPGGEHACHPLAAPLGNPRDASIDRVDSRLAQGGRTLPVAPPAAVHADEPLRRRQEDDRLMAAPAVRIRCDDDSRCHNRARSLGAAPPRPPGWPRTP